MRIAARRLVAAAVAPAPSIGVAAGADELVSLINARCAAHHYCYWTKLLGARWGTARAGLTWRASRAAARRG